MKEIVFATTNAAKVEEFDRVLTKFDFKVTHAHLEITEPYGQGLDVIAKAKVLNAFRKLGKPAAALDTGFFIKALDGYPGDNVGDVLKKGLDWILESVEGKDRNCTYRNCLAYIDETLEEPMVFESELEGTLGFSQKGTTKPLWCPIHRIFIPNGKEKTLAEIAESEEEFMSWREERYPYSTLYKFASWLSNHLS